jgi:hypothetical protein
MKGQILPRLEKLEDRGRFWNPGSTPDLVVDVNFVLSGTQSGHYAQWKHVLDRTQARASSCDNA